MMFLNLLIVGSIFQTLHVRGSSSEVLQDSGRIYDAKHKLQPGATFSLSDLFSQKSNFQDDINRLYLYPDGKENSVAKQNLPQISAELSLKLKLVNSEPACNQPVEGRIMRATLLNRDAPIRSEQARGEEQQARRL